MAKWVIEGSMTKAGPGRADPKFVSEPFLTEEGAKSFALLLNEKGYSITAKVVGETGQTQSIAGAEFLKWLNTRSA
jgi:hypothetical protein